MKWFNNLFKSKKAKPLYNIHHPEVAHKITPAFKAGGIQYYMFGAPEGQTGEFNMPVGRYKFIDSALHEAELRMDLKTLTAYIDVLEKNLNPSNGQINIGKAFQVIWAMRTRTNLGFDPQLIKRLASIVYFDETEDLTDFNEQYGRQKVLLWDKHECLDFFLTRPIKELCSLKDISQESLKNYLREVEELLKDPILDPETLSTEST
jgi:hypothetical protein